MSIKPGQDHSEEFSEKIIFNDSYKLSSSSLASLGERHSNIALKIIENDIYLEKIGGWLSLLTKHKVIAEALLKRDAFKNKRDRSILTNIAGNHYDFAKEILNNEALSSTFSVDDLHNILCLTEKTHVSELFQIILNNKNLLRLLGVSDIARIAMYCFEAGSYLLLDKEKASLLTGGDLRFFLNHVELGKIILENKVFLEKINRDDLDSFYEKPLGLVEKILSNERLQSRMREVNEQNARRVLDCVRNVRSLAKKIKEGPLFDALLETLIMSILKHLSFDARKRMREVL